MKCTAKEVLQYVEENDVKFVKLTFCDLFGRQKNVSIVSQLLPTIFENGYLFNSSAVSGFTNCAGDLLLFADPKTLSVLPWRPRTGEVISMLAYIKRPDGSFYESDALHLLDCAKQKLAKMGLYCEIATESEFYIFKQDSEGNPTCVPIDRAGYFDSAPEDAGENVRRDIILSLEDMGIVPTASHHEKGPGQNEIDFKPTEPGGAARN
ncbi:MAG: glutamine synthetase beta-grasp domain-containing protein, partial [Clostridiales bacterium]|nr:glutamine synthetase beta-grasp domain-containing protein [Clostridiales bacterium]